MDTWSAETVIIGAGVVGLAAARQLALDGHEVLVLEQEALIGSHTSSRNSEVIHAGIYYPHNSLKARHCINGRHALYNYCESHNVPFRRCGKLIVATNEAQTTELRAVLAKAQGNGVTDLRLLDQADVQALEPELDIHAALLSPSTGIIDSHSYMLSLQGEIEGNGGHVVLNSRVMHAAQDPNGQHRLTVETASDSQQTVQIQCRNVINAGGLFAANLLEKTPHFPAPQIPTMRYAKGNYFRLTRPSPFSHLIYPVPEDGGLGVHLTLDLQGGAKFGPDVQWLKHLDLSDINYRVDSSREKQFYEAIRKYWPKLRDDELTPDYSGIRPKAMQNGAINDFVIQTEQQHGLSHWINLLGIESPGLTASLSLADSICNILRSPQ